MTDSKENNTALHGRADLVVTQVEVNESTLINVNLLCWDILYEVPRIKIEKRTFRVVTLIWPHLGRPYFTLVGAADRPPGPSLAGRHKKTNTLSRKHAFLK